jgi:hypothetical protein
MVVVECGIRQGANMTEWVRKYGEGNVTVTLASGGSSLKYDISVKMENCRKPLKPTDFSLLSDQV